MILRTDAQKRRLLAELEAIRIYNEPKAPEFAIKARSQGSIIILDAYLQPARNRYRVEAQLLDNFPAHPPDIRIVEPASLPAAPHLLPGQRPCLFTVHAMYSKDRWDPSIHTVAFAILATWRWCLCFDYFLTTGRWPASNDH